ncbi:6-carboxytetrahydropterin synthase [Aurantivibrio plasticivorans]
MTSMQLFVDNLTNTDFCLFHPTRGLVGETWLSSITLEGELDDQGMICDFGIVKKAVRQLLDEDLDHRLLVPSNAPQLIHVASENNNLALQWQTNNGGTYLHRSPTQAVTLIDCDEITPESVADWCEHQLRKVLPDTVKSIAVQFNTETINGPYYHYSHGLKKHNGKCQRIAHGHRSKIEIYNDGTRSERMESEWATKFRDIFIGTREDISKQEDQSITFAYQSPEGSFSLTLPKDRAYILETESTVENIARHIAEELKQEHPGVDLRVKAYEGLAKGAFVKV